MAINVQELQGQWNKIRGMVKERWGQLTDDDLQIQSGNIDQLIGRIQQKTGEGREAIERFLDDLMSRGGSTIGQAAESVRQYAQQAAGRFRDGYEQVYDRARERYEDMEEMVRYHPTRSVATAFGLGLVVGLVVGLAFRSR
jgi:uncharacterized protein YjbJ (UPF0337 family)